MKGLDYGFRNRWKIAVRATVVAIFAGSTAAKAQQLEPVSAAYLKKLSFEELLDIEVTSVSRLPVRIGEMERSVFARISWRH